MIKIGLIGFGTVNAGVYEGITSTANKLQAILQDNVVVEKILVKTKSKHTRFEYLVDKITDSPEVFFNSEYDIVFEAISGEQPALDYVSYLLTKGVPVITANKELIAKHGKTLEKIAKRHKTFIGFEAAVAGGIPIVNVLRGQLQWTEIKQVTGILNGTTNYILTKLQKGNQTFNEVLKEAQELGYAEFDPTNDIEGIDALYKIQILSRLCYGIWPKADQFMRKGISTFESWHFKIAQKYNCQIKYIAKASFDGTNVSGFVAPCFLSNEHPLARIDDVNNGIQLESDWLGKYVASGPGAGKRPTATSMIEDYLYHYKTIENHYVKKQKTQQPNTTSQVLLIVNTKEDVAKVKQKLTSELVTIERIDHLIDGKVTMLASIKNICPFICFNHMAVEVFPVLKTHNEINVENILA